MLKSKVKSEIPSITNLGKIAAPNVKINEVNNRICNITNLASTTALFAAQNKIPNFGNLVKKCNITQKLKKKKILLNITMINMLLLKNLIS